MTSLVNYTIARAGLGDQRWTMPPIQAGLLYEYVLAANGVFVRGKRSGLEVLLPVARFENAVRGLATLEPSVRLLYPRVPAHLLGAMLQQARTDWLDHLTDHRLAFGNPTDWIEVMFDLDYDASRAAWQLIVPEQAQARTRVQPVDVYNAAHARALVHAHSHHDFAPVFSQLDDHDHTGFRVYAVLGNLSSRPTLRVRVGLYGYSMNISAWTIFEEAPEVTDAQAD